MSKPKRWRIARAAAPLFPVLAFFAAIAFATCEALLAGRPGPIFPALGLGVFAGAFLGVCAWELADKFQRAWDE